MTGVNEDTINETCTAGAGSLLVEFGILSRLLDDDRFESLARRAVGKLWSLRNNETGLLGGFFLQLFFLQLSTFSSSVSVINIEKLGHFFLLLYLSVETLLLYKFK